MARRFRWTSRFGTGFISENAFSVVLSALHPALRCDSPRLLHEPHPLILSFSPSGGEGARRAGEGVSDRFTAPMHAEKRKEASHEPRVRPRPRLADSVSRTRTTTRTIQFMVPMVFPSRERCGRLLRRGLLSAQCLARSCCESFQSVAGGLSVSGRVHQRRISRPERCDERSGHPRRQRREHVV